MAFLSASFLICERALREQDGVISAIRIVDYFMASPNTPDVPIEQRAVVVTVVGNIRATVDDDKNHDIMMTLVRPDGEETPNILLAGQPFPVSRIPDTARQVWIILQVGVLPKAFGEHQFVVTLDGVEVAKIFFTLAEYSTDNPLLKFFQPAATAP